MNDEQRFKALIKAMGIPMDRPGEMPGYHKPMEAEKSDPPLSRMAIALEGMWREPGALMWQHMTNVINDVSQGMKNVGMRQPNDPISAKIASDVCRALAHFYDGVADSVALTEGGTKPMFKETDPAFQAIADKVRHAIENEPYKVLTFRMVNIPVRK